MQILQTLNYIKKVGKTAYLKCEARGHPQPFEFSWIKGSNQLVTKGTLNELASKYAFTSDTYSTTLEVKNLQTSDTANYKCKVEHSALARESMIYLDVRDY